MNIREGRVSQLKPKHPVQDLHFRLTGPIVLHLQEVFAEDWAFSTKEILAGDLWYPPLEPAGEMLARGIRYGPDEDLGEIQLALTGALGCAHSRVSIVTPYFLPDDALIFGAERGGDAGVAGRYYPAGEEQSDHRAMGLDGHAVASARAGCRVWLTPPPFDHTKLMLVDGMWSLIGSGNWDPRSLRLNFEFNVETVRPRPGGDARRNRRSQAGRRARRSRWPTSMAAACR